MTDERIDLADPSFEPTDEQLIGLSKRAFAGVAERHAKAIARLREQIEQARRESLQAFAQRQIHAGKP